MDRDVWLQVVLNYSNFLHRDSDSGGYLLFQDVEIIETSHAYPIPDLEPTTTSFKYIYTKQVSSSIQPIFKFDYFKQSYNQGHPNTRPINVLSKFPKKPPDRPPSSNDASPSNYSRIQQCSQFAIFAIPVRMLKASLLPRSVSDRTARDFTRNLTHIASPLHWVYNSGPDWISSDTTHPDSPRFAASRRHPLPTRLDLERNDSAIGNDSTRRRDVRAQIGRSGVCDSVQAAPRRIRMRWRRGGRDASAVKREFGRDSTQDSGGAIRYKRLARCAQ
ncbi:hypothetical protein C8R43DRAFT_1127212 [Mycena crocata]|nr:hypothetical protein C8R43DRAFT_1127212 [Mycena crocata]